MKIIYGVGLIILGLGLMWYTFKNPSKENDPIAANFQGMLGGILMVVIGLFMILASEPPHLAK